MNFMQIDTFFLAVCAAQREDSLINNVEKYLHAIMGYYREFVNGIMPCKINSAFTDREKHFSACCLS
jgi:hypothetical protein